MRSEVSLIRRGQAAASSAIASESFPILQVTADFADERRYSVHGSRFKGSAVGRTGSAFIVTDSVREDGKVDPTRLPLIDSVGRGRGRGRMAAGGRKPDERRRTDADAGGRGQITCGLPP